MLANYQKSISIYVKRNKATFNDDYLKIKSATIREFFNVGKIISDLGADSANTVYEASILLDPSKDVYQRSVFTIMDLFGVIGGIYGLLISGWGLLVGIISSQILLSSVFRRLYYCFTINWNNLYIYIYINY